MLGVISKIHFVSGAGGGSDNESQTFGNRIL